MILFGTGWHAFLRPAVLVTAVYLHAADSAATHVPEMPEHPEQAESEEGSAVAITIDAEHLIELYQYVTDLMIIDSRHAEDYVLGHIETSINLPLAKTSCKTLKKLAKSTERAIVFYSNNNAGDASIEAIRIASGCGYRRLFWLRGGFIEWKDKDYPYVIE